MRIRLARQPDALLGTSTHDTKRGEDARARLYTLTEAPEQWGENLARWRQMNQTRCVFNDGTARQTRPIPDDLPCAGGRLACNVVA